MKSSKLIREIQNCGHEIGLHFDEMKYPQAIGNVDKIKEQIIKEADIVRYFFMNLNIYLILVAIGGNRWKRL